MRRTSDVSAGALAAMVVAGLGIAVWATVASGMLPLTAFITPGPEGPAASLIVEDFGAGAFHGSETGYDGQQAYPIARFFPDLEAAAPHTDAPRYRMLRVL